MAEYGMTGRGLSFLFMVLNRCFAILLLSLFTQETHAANCDKCPTPDVVMYDFAVNIPKPTDLTDYSNWLGHFNASSSAGAEVFKDNMCIDFYNGGALTSTTTGESFKVGADVAHTPPSGPIGEGGKNYLLTGSVDRSGSGYLVTMAVEGACNRETLLTATTTYSDPADARSAGAKLAQDHFRPLLSKIREFEYKLRKTDIRVAVDNLNGGFDMEAAKRHARPSETVPITITLTDCDGTPLPDRTLLLTPREKEWGPPSHNGKFNVSTIKTNGSGKATVGFTVGGVPGPATARVYFSYLEPSGCEKINGSDVVINVDGAAQYKGKATFTSPVADTTGVADVTWTLIDKSRIENRDEDDGEDSEMDDEEIDNDELLYAASGTIRGTINVPDCDPKHVELPIKSGPDGEMAINFADKAYRFEFSADTEVSLMCGKPRRPWVISGASVFHYEGGLCAEPPGFSENSSIEDIMTAVAKMKTGVPYTDLKTLTGEETCNTGMFGTTKWEFKAVQ